jgi:hypothetical protein
MPKSKKTRTREEQDGGINLQKLATKAANFTPTGRAAKFAYNQVTKRLPPGAIQAAQGHLGQLSNTKGSLTGLQGPFGSLTKNLPQMPSRSPSPQPNIFNRLRSNLPQMPSRSPSPTSSLSEPPLLSQNISSTSQLPPSVTPLTLADIPSNISATFPAAQAAVDNAELQKLEEEITTIAQQQTQTGGATLVEIDTLRTNAKKLLRQAEIDNNRERYKEIEEDLKMINTLQEISKQEPTHHTISEIRAKLNNILIHATERNDTTLKTQVLSDLDKLYKIEQKTPTTTVSPINLPSSTITPDQNASKFARMFPLLTGVIIYILSEFKIPSNTTIFFAICGLILVLASMILSLTYLIILATESANAKLIANPLNLQSPDYNVSKSIQFFGSEYKYQLFIILPILGVLSSGFALYYSIKYDVNQSGLVKGIIIGCLIQSLIALILNSLSYSYGSKRLRTVNNKINDLNNYIHNKIYKNAPFLSNLKEIPHDSLSASVIVKKALNNIEHKANVKTISNAFFTLNLYYHFQKIGFRNEYITDAMNIFDIHSLFKGSSFKDKINFMNSISQASWSPVDFLFRRTSFIEDRSQELKKIFLEISGNATHARTVDLAINEVSKWLAEINARSNMINPQDSWKGFITMAILTLIIQTAPLLIIIYIYQKYYK